ncbi:MAG: hypothetical protein CVU39_17880 [Chloroflexi bacterium HGW-Chloroflexi-10]|nr:MAG: hypothetical protein CVU39_17880 [Chloroflexi bacterium HGW-Chloroflexi-10]
MRKNKIIGLCFCILLSACMAQQPTTMMISSTQVINTPVVVLEDASTSALPTPTQFEATKTVLPPIKTTIAPTQPVAPVLPVSDLIVVDHMSVEKFDLIPDEVLQQAASLRVMIRGSSVEENIRYGLECLHGNFPDRRPNSCSEFFNLKYDPALWNFQLRGNPGWIEKVDDFVRETDNQSNQHDVFMFTVGYLDGLDGMSFPEISNPENFKTQYVDKLEELEDRHPDKIFVWWNMSLAQQGQQNTQQFNDTLRAYAFENQKIFFDLADIEAYDFQGNPCKDENQYEVICSDYTEEKVSGHLNETARERVAKAFWYLMARLTGWKEE